MRLVKTRHLTEYAPAETGEYPCVIPQFLNPLCFEKYLKIN